MCATGDVADLITALKRFVAIVHQLRTICGRPMKIRRIAFKAHPILGDLELDLVDKVSDRAHDTIVIAGENGTGKTALLQSIFTLISGSRAHIKRLEIELGADSFKLFSDYYENWGIRPREPVAALMDEDHRGTAGPLVEFDTSEGLQWRGYDPGGTLPASPFRVFYSEAFLGYADVTVGSFGGSRLITEQDAVRAGPELAQQVVQRMLDMTAADNQDIAEWVYQNPDQIVPEEMKRRRIKRFDDAISFMFPRKRLANIHGAGMTVSDHGTEITLNQLSTGEKQVLYRAGFILNNASRIPGSLILVDEPELGLHPDWQSKTIGFYQKLLGLTDAASAQLIFATHSPFIVHDAPNAKVVVLKRHRDGRVAIEEEPAYPTTGYARVAKALNVPFVMSATTKPAVVLVEGESDQLILEAAWSKLFPRQNCPFEFRSAFGTSQIRTALNAESTYRKNSSKKLFAIFDFDKAYADWTGTWKKDGILIEADPRKGLTKKHRSQKAWAMLLPIPTFRDDIAGEDLGADSRLSIELMFQDLNVVPDLVSWRRAPGGGRVPIVKDSKKMELGRVAQALPADAFQSFQPIFQGLNTHLEYET